MGMRRLLDVVDPLEDDHVADCRPVEDVSVDTGKGRGAKPVVAVGQGPVAATSRAW